MLLLFRRLILTLALAALCQTNFGFALLGPRDAWQVSALGYDPQGDAGDLGGPKLLGSEWRWTLPVITYAFDQSFIDWFGTNGVIEVNRAVDAFNREMVNLNELTDAQLRTKPLEARRRHQTAEALGILDLRTVTMGLLAEQLGLAGAERWTWALRSRAVLGPVITNYAVIQLNYDPYSLKPTPYVNGRRFSYRIMSLPAALFAAAYEDAVEFELDQSNNAFQASTVSSMVGEELTQVQIAPGEYFTSLSQDDIGGLRYMYRRSNINREPLPIATTDVAGTAPAIRVVDTNALTFINAIDAFTFGTNTAFLNPSNLLAQFPGLQPTSTNFFITNIVSRNFVITNLLPTGTNLFTNFAALTLITNQDLFTFSEATRTNDPATLLARYPGLIITSTNAFPVLVTNQVFSLTNSVWAAPFDPPILVTNLVVSVQPNYRYTFANVITNYATPFTDIEVDVIGNNAPWASPGDFTLFTNQIFFRTNVPSGGFFILNRGTNANLLGYSFVDANGVPLVRAASLVSVTNTIQVVTNAAGIGFPLNVVNTTLQTVYAAYPILFNTPIGQELQEVLTTNTVIGYSYTFDTNNLVNIPIGNGTPVTLVTTVFTNGILRVTSQIVGNDPGAVVIIDPTQFVLATNIPPIISQGFATNVLTSYTNALTGEFITEQLVFLTNSIRVAVFPVTFVTPTTPQLREGVNTLQFRQQHFLDFYDQANAVSTNLYNIVATSGNVEFPQQVRRVAGPDILFTAGDLGVTTGGFPVGWARNVRWEDRNGALVTQANEGPGLIVPGATISFSKLAPSWINQTPGAVSEETQILYLSWGSFDGETITPRVYPEDVTGEITTLQQLEAIALGFNQPPPQ